MSPSLNVGGCFVNSVYVAPNSQQDYWLIHSHLISPLNSDWQTPTLTALFNLLQWLGSRVAHLVDWEMLPLLEGLTTLVTDVVPLLWAQVKGRLWCFFFLDAASDMLHYQCAFSCSQNSKALAEFNYFAIKSSCTPHLLTTVPEEQTKMIQKNILCTLTVHPSNTSKYHVPWI